MSHIERLFQSIWESERFTPKRARRERERSWQQHPGKFPKEVVLMAGTGTGQVAGERDPFFENEGNSPNGKPASDEVRTTLPRGFEERKEPRLFKFTTALQMLEGHVAGFLRSMIGGKPSVDIFIAVDERTDQFVKVHATRQMLEKIHTTDAGRKVRIVYQGESPIKTVGNPMRMFTIQVDTTSEPRTDLLMDTSLLEMLQDES